MLGKGVKNAVFPKNLACTLRASTDIQPPKDFLAGSTPEDVLSFLDSLSAVDAIQENVELAQRNDLK